MAHVSAVEDIVYVSLDSKSEPRDGGARKVLKGIRNNMATGRNPSLARRSMKPGRVAAIVGSTCLHAAVIAIVLRVPGFSPAGPDGGGDVSAPFFVETAAKPDAAAAPEPLSEPASTPAEPEQTPVPMPVQPMVQVPVEAIAVTESEWSAGAPLRVTQPSRPRVKEARAASALAKAAKQVSKGSRAGTGGQGGGQGYAGPMYLSTPEPVYPPEAKAARIEGLVMLEVTVDDTGRPTGVSVLRGSGSEDLDRAAVAGVDRWRFRPATVGGRAVAASVQVPVRFRLK